MKRIFSLVLTLAICLSLLPVIAPAKMKAEANETIQINENYSITINDKTGLVTVKKGTPKGTYKINVKMKAAATKKTKAMTVTKTLKIIIK